MYFQTAGIDESIAMRLSLFKYSLVIISFFTAVPMARGGGPIPIYVSIVPQKYFVQQIGRDLVEVHVMVSPGASPATYEPKPRQMAGISRARAYFAVGVPFEERWLAKIAAANPRMTVVRTDRGIKKIPMAAGHHFEAAGEEGRHEEHDHAGQGQDPHIWLSPPLVKTQARHILLALKEMDPANGARFEQNYAAFMREVDDLDARLRQSLDQWKDRRFLVFHPSWGYFAQAYGLKMSAIEVEGKAPKPAQLKALIEHARKEGIKVVFVQPQFSTKSAALIAREIGGEVAFADPLAEQWSANLIRVAEQLKTALK